MPDLRLPMPDRYADPRDLLDMLDAGGIEYVGCARFAAATETGGILMNAPNTGPTIFDFGMNNGNDLPYYLAKASKVVGVEADPSLCDLVRARYPQAVRSGHLVIENCVLSGDQDDGDVEFYIHTSNNVLSQFPRPSAEKIGEFKMTKVRQRLASSLVRQHGEPHYIKLDLEHYDSIILDELFREQIYPQFISSEIHDLKVFQLIKDAGYTSFNFVNGRDVSQEYQNTQFQDLDGNQQTFSFPQHSAGPFGADLHFPWLRGWQMNLLLRGIGGGWRDLHASRFPVQRTDIGSVLRLVRWIGRRAYSAVRWRLKRKG